MCVRWNTEMPRSGMAADYDSKRSRSRKSQGMYLVQVTDGFGPFDV